MYRAAATATAAAAAMSRSTSSAMRRQVARCGGGGEQRYWSRGFAAKDVTVARAAVKEERTLGVEIRARAAGTEDGTFRVAIQRCVSDLRGDFKTPKEVAFGVGARAAMLNNLADDVKNSSYTSFRLDARPALSDLADTIDLQGIVEELAKEDGANLASTNKPARHVNNTWAPHGHGHPATQVYSRPYSAPAVGIFGFGKAGMPLSCAARKLNGGFSNVYSRQYSAPVTPTEEEEERRRAEEEEKRRQEEKRRNEDNDDWTFLLFVKKYLNILKAWRVSSRSNWTKLEPRQRYYYQLLVAAGGLELGGGAIMFYSQNKTQSRMVEKFNVHKDAIKDLQNQQEKDFVAAEGLAADDRAKEASQRSIEAMQRSKFAEGELAQMGRQMYEFQHEIAEIKKIVLKLAEHLEDRK